MPQLHILCICKGCPILKSGPFKQTLPVGVCVCVCKSLDGFGNFFVHVQILFRWVRLLARCVCAG